MSQSVLSTVAERLANAVRGVARKVNDEPHGTLEIEWRDGIPQMVRVTTKHKPE